MKLKAFNDKIKTFRDELQNTGSSQKAYLAMLSKFYGKYAIPRFYSKAEEFANRMMIAATSGIKYQQRYPLSSLADYWEIYATKIIFEL